MGEFSLVAVAFVWRRWTGWGLRCMDQQQSITVRSASPRLPATMMQLVCTACMWEASKVTESKRKLFDLADALIRVHKTHEARAQGVHI